MTTEDDARDDSAGRVVDSTTVRRRAEEKARATGDQDLEALWPEEARRLVHELRVHQIELEMQNEELRRAQEELELIIDSMPAYIAYTDSELKILHINRALAEWWGYSKEQVVGRNFEEVARPGGYEHNAPYFRQAVASRETVAHEYQTVSAAGQAVVAQVTSVPHPDEQGNTQGLVILILDVTEQRRVEAELRTQQQLLELIIDSMPAYIVYFDSGLNVLHANRALAEWLGYSKEKIVGKRFEEVARPGSHEHNAPYFRQALASRQTVTHELQSVSVAGRSAVVQAISVPQQDEQGNVQGLLVHMLDITEQRRAEEALRASQERYRLVVENMRDGVVMTDEPGRLTYVNDRLCEITGRTRDEMIGQSSSMLFFGGERGRHRNQLARRRAGFSDTYESVLVRRDGSQVPVLVSASPIKDPQGRYKGGFAVVSDISMRKRVEQALLKAKLTAEVARAAAETARLEEQGRRFESERRRRLAEGLTDVLTALNAKRPLDDVLNLVVRQARQLLPAQAAAIYGLEGPARTLRVHATQGLIGALFSETSVLSIRVALEEAITQCRPVAVAELPTDPGRSRDLDRQADLSQAQGLDSFLAAPILLEDLAYGGLVVSYSRPRSITTEDKELTALLAAQAALAVENTRLRAEVEEAAIASERTRLARELHDSVTQALFSASLISETLPHVWERHPQEAQHALGELHQLTHGALAEMRALLLELRPATLLAQPLDLLIAQLADAMPARIRCPVLTTVAGDCTTPDDVKLAIYRIAQEALNNVVKHAHAGQVQITLHGEPGHLMLSVKDDGQGFDPAGVESHHLGMGIMHERADAVGAQLSVESQPGQGTTITVSWSGA